MIRDFALWTYGTCAYTISKLNTQEAVYAHGVMEILILILVLIRRYYQIIIKPDTKNSNKQGNKEKRNYSTLVSKPLQERFQLSHSLLNFQFELFIV